MDKKLILNDKQLTDEEMIENSINNSIINSNKSIETLNKVLINEKISEENKLIDDLIHENENLREIIRLCLVLITCCRCRNRKNTSKRTQINLLLTNYNNNSINDNKVFTNNFNKENFQLLAVNQVINDCNNYINSSQVSDNQFIGSKDVVNCDEEEKYFISESDDNDWCEENCDEDWPEDDQRSDDRLISDCLNNRWTKKSKNSNQMKSREKSVKLKTNLEISGINNSTKSYVKLKSTGKSIRKRGRIRLVRDPNTVYRCDWIGCGKVFKNQSNLNGHKDIHLEIKKYRCDWPGCDEGFLRKEQLDVHISHHTNEKRFKCLWPGCGYQTCHTAKLRTHKRIHTGEKPYKCDWPGCEFSTSYEKGLKRHKMRHTGEKPYKCSWPQCEWSFRQPTHLKAHMLKHTGEKPFVCEFNGCDRRFSSRQAMRFHLEKSHK